MNTLVICRKELNSYFASPIAYGLMAFFAAIAGYFFYVATAIFVSRGMEAQMMQQPMPMDVNDWVVRPVLMNVSVIGLFIIPMITMRLFAEEKRQGTIELLATSPITDLQIVLGKFLAAVALYAVMLCASLLNVALLWRYATVSPDWRPVVTGTVGLLLLGSCFIALGLFVSTLTRNQIIAGFLSFCLFLGVWTLGWADDPMAGPVMKVVAYLGVTNHLEDLIKGVLDLKDLVFYMSFIGFSLFLAHQSVASQRWRV